MRVCPRRVGSRGSTHDRAVEGTLCRWVVNSGYLTGGVVEVCQQVGTGVWWERVWKT